MNCELGIRSDDKFVIFILVIGARNFEATIFNLKPSPFIPATNP